MNIVYNPLTGAPIKGFNFEGKLVEEHKVGEMKKYEPLMAEALVFTYPFMRIVTEEEAKKITEELEKGISSGEFKCDKCDYSSVKKIGLLGHMKGHAKDDVSVSAIPVAEIKQMGNKDNVATEIPDDLKGADWYGEGVTEVKNV